MNDGTESRNSKNPGVSDLRASEKQAIRGNGSFENPNKVENLTQDTKKPSLAERRSERNEEGAASLNDAEKNAEENSSSNNEGGLYRGNLDRVKDGENNPGGLYRQSGVMERRKITGGKSKGKLKKIGPLALILISTVGFGGALLGMQTFMPFSVKENFMKVFNSMHISTKTRWSILIKFALKGGIGENDNTATLATATTDNDVSSVLAVNNGKADATMTTASVASGFAGGSVVLTEKQIDSLARCGIKYSDGTLEFKGKSITADNFDDFYYHDSDFHRAYNAASESWMGQSANWYGSATNDLLADSKLTRNLFNNYRNEVDASNSTSLAVLKGILGDKINNSNTRGGSHTSTDEYITDTSGLRSNAARTIDYVAQTYKKAVSVKCGLVAFGGAISTLAAAVETLQLMNLTMGLFESVDKAKAGYGSGSPINEFATSLVTKGGSLNMSVDSSGNMSKGDTTEMKSAIQSEGIRSLYDNRAVNASDVSVRSMNVIGYLPSMLRSNPEMAKYADNSMDEFMKCTIASISKETLRELALTSCVVGFLPSCVGLIIGWIIDFFKSVVLQQAVSALADRMAPVVRELLVRDLAETLIGNDFGNAITAGANKYMQKVHRANGGSPATQEKYVDYAVVQKQVIADDKKYQRESMDPLDATSNNTFIGTIFSSMMPFITNTGSLASAIMATSSVMNNSIAALQPSVVADAQKIAEGLPSEEEYKETAMYLSSVNAVGDAYGSEYGFTDMSTMSMTPAEVIDKIRFVERGGELIPNFYDTSGGNGNVVIREDSPLAKYIVYCTRRESPLGMADYNIAASIVNWGRGGVNKNSSMYNLGNVQIGGLPLAGDDTLGSYQAVVNEERSDVDSGGTDGENDGGAGDGSNADLKYGENTNVNTNTNTNAGGDVEVEVPLSEKEAKIIQIQNAGYISGESCVAGNDFAIPDTRRVSDSPEWETEGKYYQRFIEDQATAETVGAVSQSAVTAFLEKYEEDNPVDDSVEGVLARYTGLDMNRLNTVVATLWYSDYLANYKPEERYVFDGAERPGNGGMRTVEFDNENVFASDFIPREVIIYADVRNRNYVA